MQNVLQLSDIEIQMLKEVQRVFLKYSANTRKFALQLSHEHFPLQAQEILYETHDSNKRTLNVTPVLYNVVKDTALATAWKFNEQGQIEVTQFCCGDDGGEGPPPPPIGD